MSILFFKHGILAIRSIEGQDLCQSIQDGGNKDLDRAKIDFRCEEFMWTCFFLLTICQEFQQHRSPHYRMHEEGNFRMD